MSFIPQEELKSLEEQAVLQDGQRKALLNYLGQHAPFYKRLFASLQLDPFQPDILNYWERIPTTTKDDLQSYNFDFLCIPPNEIVEYTASSGTLGRPVTIALSGNDLNRLAYNEYLSFCSMGVEPGQVFQLMLTLDRQFMAGMAYFSGLRQLGAAAIRTGPGLPQMQWETIQRLQPDGVVAVPGFLLKMINYAKEHQIDLKTCKVKKALVIGDSIRDEQLNPGVLARQISEEWDIKLYGTYASTEMQTAFTECHEGAGGHHHPSLIYVELLDDAGNPVEAGMPGEVTVSTFGIEAMPLLRYRTGDICRAYTEPCSCGRKTLRLGPVLGRKKQMIKYKGTTLYPPAIFDLLHEATFIEDYVVEVNSDALGQDQIIIHLSSSVSMEECRNLFYPILQSRLRVVPEIQLHSAEQLVKMQYPNAGRKPLRFIDNRNIT